MAAAAMQQLLGILDLETIEQNLFRGRSPQDGWQRVFGGQVIGQALVAAQRTVRRPATSHSLHAYFMRPGDPAVPIIYEVDRIRDGGSFTTRRVVAIQHGQAIFSLVGLVPGRRGGPRPPDADAARCRRPRRCCRAARLVRRFSPMRPGAGAPLLERERPIELRPVDPRALSSAREKLEPVQQIWVRATGAGARRSGHPRAPCSPISPT